MKKKSIPTLKELLDRYVKCIEFQNPHVPKITAAGKLLLESHWVGKEEQLYKMVKDIEVKIVQTKNLSERFETRSCTFQVGVDVLGFPIFTVHETLVQYNLSSNKKITSTAIIDKIQYDFKATN